MLSTQRLGPNCLESSSAGVCSVTPRVSTRILPTVGHAASSQTIFHCARVSPNPSPHPFITGAHMVPLKLMNVVKWIIDQKAAEVVRSSEVMSEGEARFRAAHEKACSRQLPCVPY